MMEVILGSLAVPWPLQERLRVAPLVTTQFDRETWHTRAPVALHEDSTAFGLATYGVILVNDADWVLAYDDAVYAIPVGTCFRIEARRSHGALRDTHHSPERIGCFAFLAWDMPADTKSLEFKLLACEAIKRKDQGLEPLP